MGNAESNENHKFDGCETLGYRILGVQPDSPASRAGLVSFFDFLVGANGQLLFGVDDGSGGDFFEDIDFPALLKNSVDQEVELLVWNIKNKTQRFLTLTPTTKWGGKGLIGVTIRMDDYAIAEENLLRVLSVEKKSPAAIAGLTPNTDYLLGTTMDSFESEDVLADVLEINEESVVEIYVYNTESDVVRVVTLLPTLKWGGRGLLGAEIGRGYLHRLPKSCRDTLGVSFERKVRLNDADATTSCGAVDLKLNEAAADEMGVQENTVKDALASEVQGNSLDKKEKDSTAGKEVPSTDNLIEGVGNSNIEDTNGKEIIDECSNSTKESSSEPAAETSDDGDKVVEETPTKRPVEYDQLSPVPIISKFPTTPQLQDFTLIGMTTASQTPEAMMNLPPPPTSVPIVEDASNEGEMTAIDLR